MMLIKFWDIGSIHIVRSDVIQPERHRERRKKRTPGLGDGGDNCL